MSASRALRKIEVQFWNSHPDHVWCVHGCVLRRKDRVPRSMDRLTPGSPRLSVQPSTHTHSQPFTEARVKSVCSRLQAGKDETLQGGDKCETWLSSSQARWQILCLILNKLAGARVVTMKASLWSTHRGSMRRGLRVRGVPQAGDILPRIQRRWGDRLAACRANLVIGNSNGPFSS